MADAYVLLEKSQGRGQLILRVQRAGQVVFEEHMLSHAMPVELRYLGVHLHAWDSEDDLYRFFWETEAGVGVSIPAVPHLRGSSMTTTCPGENLRSSCKVAGDSSSSGVLSKLLSPGQLVYSATCASSLSMGYRACQSGAMEVAIASGV